MQKGQVSFDFILAVIVALIFVGGMQLVNTSMQEMQKESAVRNQEKLIAMNVYKVVSSAAVLSDADDFEVKYTTQKLLVPKEAFLQECTIEIGPPSQVQYGAGGEQISVEIPADTSALIFNKAQYHCGETITISK